MPAQKGNKYAQKYTLDEAMELFIIGLEYAESNDNCLSLADAIKQTTIAYSTYDYLAEKHEVLGYIKNDTKTEVTRRINKHALKGEFNATSSIWRMKQLGEKDKTEVQNTNVDVPLTSDEIESYKKKNKDFLDDY
jgi:uncharacterized LabA/DUF88 family protein